MLPPGSGTALRRGFTVVELMITIALSAVLLSIAVPAYQSYVQRAQTAAAIADIGQIQMLVYRYASANNGTLPPDLPTIGMDTKVDPWGSPYYYHTTVGGTGNGVGRRDKSLHPINTDFDLYSSGPDRKSVAPLTAKPSQDDIIRANDGSFVGAAANY